MQKFDYIRLYIVFDDGRVESCKYEPFYVEKADINSEQAELVLLNVSDWWFSELLGSAEGSEIDYYQAVEPHRVTHVAWETGHVQKKWSVKDCSISFYREDSGRFLLEINFDQSFKED